MLLAAGDAPMYSEHGLDSSALAHVSRALTRLLEHQEPYPAVVLDRQWKAFFSADEATERFAREHLIADS